MTFKVLKSFSAKILTRKNCFKIVGDEKTVVNTSIANEGDIIDIGDDIELKSWCGGMEKDGFIEIEKKPEKPPETPKAKVKTGAKKNEKN